MTVVQRGWAFPRLGEKRFTVYRSDLAVGRHSDMMTNDIVCPLASVAKDLTLSLSPSLSLSLSFAYFLSMKVWHFTLKCQTTQVWNKYSTREPVCSINVLFGRTQSSSNGISTSWSFTVIISCLLGLLNARVHSLFPCTCTCFIARRAWRAQGFSWFIPLRWIVLPIPSLWRNLSCHIKNTRPHYKTLWKGGEESPLPVQCTDFAIEAV